MPGHVECAAENTFNVLALSTKNCNTLSGKKKSGKIFVGEKFCHLQKI